MLSVRHIALVTVIGILLYHRRSHAEQSPFTAVLDPQNSLKFQFLKNGKTALRMDFLAWGPKWGWRDISSQQRATGDTLDLTTPFFADKAKGDIISLSQHVAKSGDRAIAFRYELSAEKDVPLQMLCPTFVVPGAFHPGELILGSDGDKTESIKVPTPILGIKKDIRSLTFKLKDGLDIVIALEPACSLHIDNNSVRLMLAADLFKQGKSSIAMTVTLPENVDLLIKSEDIAALTKTLAEPDWFVFEPTDDTGPSVIGMEEWLEKPAGKHGGVRMVGDHFELADGQRIKFWGTNLCYKASAPEHEEGQRTAERFAKYGINAVRMHKFTGPGWEGIGDKNDSTKMEPKGLEKLDFFSKQLRDRGIYYGWSHTFGFIVRPGDKGRVAGFDEIMKQKGGKTYGLINIAEDVQDLMIESIVNVLKHKNPYTDLTYAEDPALNFIELQNEDDIFFYTTTEAFEKYPTYRKLLLERFAEWLKDKYKTQEGLKQAWGAALKDNEALDKHNIGIQPNPWFFGTDNLPLKPAEEQRRLLDNAAFFHHVQNKFYSKFVNALRDAGYKGPILGSPWQAPSMLPHYYNLYSDYLTGYIDRHNYFDGTFQSMLKTPGSGYFSSGMQQVIDRPFALSEWSHVYPACYSAEGPAIIAAYGMGLQGWDASYQFQSFSNKEGFHKDAGSPPWGVWNVDVPNQIGQYPALSRMIYRNDVKEGEVISVRRVRPKELVDGKFDFSDKVVQSGDVKSFGGAVPTELLAAGRVVVEFADNDKPSEIPDASKWINNKIVTSGTKELLWNYAEKGFFTVDTAGTKGVVGFANGKEFQLGEFKLNVNCPYASILITSLEKTAPLATTKKALITAVARISNTGFTYYTLDNRVLQNGKAPILIEPVKATVSFGARKVTAVHLLDHDGRMTEKAIPVTDGRIEIDGARDKALYYEIEFE